MGLCPAVLESGSLPALAWREQNARENLALAHPRVLLRLPYGEQTEPIEEFEFEEFEDLADGPVESDYLWGSAALALGVALASWQEKGGAFGEISDLPLHVYRHRGEVRSLGPVAELLSESRIKELNDAGISCIVGIVGGDSAQVVGLRSTSGGSLLIEDGWR
jgi:type VI secretion system protein ImpC